MRLSKDVLYVQGGKLPALLFGHGLALVLNKMTLRVHRDRDNAYRFVLAAVGLCREHKALLCVIGEVNSGDGGDRGDIGHLGAGSACPKDHRREETSSHSWMLWLAASEHLQ